MTTTARIAAKKAAATYTASIASGSVANFKAVGLSLDERVLINSLSSTLSGAHDGGNDEAVLTDSGEDWGTDQFVGYTISNTTDGSSGTVTANTATTITATLSGGTDDDWDTGDAYTLSGYTPLSYIDEGGDKRQAVLAFGDNSRQLTGPLDIEISKPKTTNAVEVVEYS
jgi:hypothetical protein